MPRYAYKTQDGEAFEFECSWEHAPDYVGELRAGLKGGYIRPVQESLESLSERLEKRKCDEELFQDFGKQKPQAHYINWISDTK